MWHIKLPLSKGRFLLRGEVGWVTTWFGGKWNLAELEQSWVLRRVLQFQLVIVGGKRDFLWLYFWSSLAALEWSGIWYFLIFSWCVFPGRVSWIRVGNMDAWVFETEMRRLLGIYWNLFYLAYGIWKVLMNKNWRGNRKKSFHSETWGKVVWGGVVKILWNSPRDAIL